MKYLQILSLHFEQVFQHRSRSFVWFLIAFFHPLLMLLFWNGASNKGSLLANGWSSIDLTTYYLLLMIAGSLLVAHIEEDVAERDIREGALVKYLLKPVSYYWFKFYEELPWRVLQAFYGVIITSFLFLFVIKGSGFSISLTQVALVPVILTLAYFISFSFKMVIGLCAFWFIDMWGIFELIEVLMVIFAGFVMPLSFFPTLLMQVAYALPFSYMIYFPVIAVKGKLSLNESLEVIGVQIVWLIVFGLLYRYLWSQGVKKFTAVGQ